MKGGSPLLVLKLKQARLPAWRGYTANKSGFLPRRMSWMQPDAADDLARMMEACGDRFEVTDGYRSVAYQIESISRQKHKRRLFAPPTKSGHNFGWSIDVKIAHTLENFRSADDAEIRAAGRDRAALVRWMARFGWTGIRKESWHFNHLAGHVSTVKRIEAQYAAAMALDNADVQRALNALVGKKLDEPLVVDGILGTKTSSAARVAEHILNTNDRGAFSAWFRRVLAGATAKIEEVK